MEKKVIKIEQVFILLEALEELYTQHVKYPINIAYKLNRIKNELNDIEKYTLERIAEVIPNWGDIITLSAEENLVYTAIMNSEIEIETYGLTKDELFTPTTNDQPVIELGKIEALNLLV